MKVLRFLILFFFASLPNFSVRAQGGIFSRQLSHPAIFAITQDSSFFSHLTRDSVREQNKEWSQTEIAMPGGIISPTPPGLSPATKFLYLLLAVVLISLSFGFLIRFFVQKERLSLLQRRAELRQQHIDFMTNISHEFRTPLTLILGPVKELKKSCLNDEDLQLVQLIERNAEQMQSLLKQILPGREGRVTDDSLKIRQNDLVSIVASMINQFSFAALQKEQQLTTAMPESCLAWFDTEIVSKVLGNLISNAIKYTPREGHICVSLEMQEGNAVLKVQDDGIGVPENRRERIFDRFDRLGRDDSEIEGSGIGLNFARKIATLHGGTLTYAPAPSRGSIFIFSFPAMAESYPESHSFSDHNSVETFVSDPIDPEKHTLFIVEDTDEIRVFLCRIFADNYNIIASSNGLEAIDNLKLLIPDLVLSDVIMPGKTGYGLCREIKENPSWNHIPVILLTAKADAESSVEGMKVGADAYVPKPFDPDVLKATVESIIRNRIVLQEKVRDFTSDNLQVEAEKVQLPEADRIFLEKMHDYLDSRLEDADFNVADIAREIGMSYSSLYAKIKATTGMTPQNYITRYRMNIARKLLQDGSLSISEIAWRVGSSSPSTFSREFKNHFGYPPSREKTSKP